MAALVSRMRAAVSLRQRSLSPSCCRSISLGQQGRGGGGEEGKATQGMCVWEGGRMGRAQGRV
jgi:hypothetical protein